MLGKTIMLVFVTALSSAESLIAQGENVKDVKQNSENRSRFDFEIQGGTTLTLVPDFQHTVLWAPDGLNVPGYIHPTNPVEHIFAMQVQHASLMGIGMQKRKLVIDFRITGTFQLPLE